MDESLLRTIGQLQEFLKATPDVGFTAHGGDGDSQRYGHISRVLTRIDYPRRNKAERGVLQGTAQALHQNAFGGQSDRVAPGAATQWASRLCAH